MRTYEAEFDNVVNNVLTKKVHCGKIIEFNENFMGSMNEIMSKSWDVVGPAIDFEISNYMLKFSGTSKVMCDFFNTNLNKIYNCMKWSNDVIGKAF